MARLYRGMKQALHHLAVATKGQGFYQVTAPICRWVASQGVGTGLLTVWCRHTSCSLVVQENASPDVLTDLQDFFRRIVPENAGYRHDDEGPDDMPAHIKAALTLTQISIPVSAGAPLLGTWQGAFLFEHRDAPHRRELVLHLLGE